MKYVGHAPCLFCVKVGFAKVLAVVLGCVRLPPVLPNETLRWYCPEGCDSTGQEPRRALLAYPEEVREGSCGELAPYGAEGAGEEGSDGEVELTPRDAALTAFKPHWRWQGEISQAGAAICSLKKTKHPFTDRQPWNRRRRRRESARWYKRQDRRNLHKVT